MTDETYVEQWNGTTSNVGYKKILADWSRDMSVWVDDLNTWIQGGKVGTRPPEPPTTDVPTPPDLP